MLEKLKLYLVLLEFPVFVIDILRIFLCVFSITLVGQDDSQKISNFRTKNTNFSICTNYLLLLIDCVLFYFIKFNKITVILMLRILYLLLSVSLIMVLLNDHFNQQVNQSNCCFKIDKIDLLHASSTNRLNLAIERPKILSSNHNQTSLSPKRRLKKKKVLIRSSNENCTILRGRDEILLNQKSRFNLTSSPWLEDYLKSEQYFKYTEIVLIILSMIIYSLSIFTIDIYFFQIPYA